MKVHRTLRAVPSFAALTLLAMASASPAFARPSGSSHHSGSTHSSHSSGPSSHGSHNGSPGTNHDGSHNGGGFHGGGSFHGSDGFHNGGFHNGGGFHGGGGFGFRGYYYPSFWGSIFLGYPYPSWYYGPWGYYGASAGYGYYGDGYRDRQEQGALDLDLSPADTQVYLNGQYIGVVNDFDGWPQYLWLDPGTYDLAFYREGYKTLARQVTVYRGLVIDWDDRLEQGTSVRPEDLPSANHERRDARVEQDREMKEKAERGGDSWRDRVRGERYRHDRGDDHNGRDDRNDRNDRGSENAPPTAPRNGEAGRLHLAIDPHDASVYLDGRFLGTADDVSRLSSGLLVDPGSHTLSVVRPGRHAEERLFEVRPGEQVDLRIELKGE